MELLERVLEHEGFKAKPYQDHLGNWTFGHGLTFITEEESRGIVAGRLHKNEEILRRQHSVLNTTPQEVVDVLTEMSFQMGLSGVARFEKMWAALGAGEFELAAREMLDSKWAKQTPERAEALAEIVRGKLI